MDCMVLKASSATAAASLVSAGATGTLWGVDLPIGIVLGSEGDRVVIMGEGDLLTDLDSALPEDVEFLRSGGFRGVSEMSDTELCYYILGKASA